MDVVGAVGGDFNLIEVGTADGGGTVVGFQDVRTMVDIAKAENTQLAGPGRCFKRRGESPVVSIDLELAHAIDLKHAFRGSEGYECEIVMPEIRGDLYAIEGSLHIGEAEVSDQALRNAR